MRVQEYVAWQGEWELDCRGGQDPHSVLNGRMDHRMGPYRWDEIRCILEGGKGKRLGGWSGLSLRGNWVVWKCVMQGVVGRPVGGKVDGRRLENGLG